MELTKTGDSERKNSKRAVGTLLHLRQTTRTKLLKKFCVWVRAVWFQSAGISDRLSKRQSKLSVKLRLGECQKDTSLSCASSFCVPPSIDKLGSKSQADMFIDARARKYDDAQHSVKRLIIVYDARFK